MTDNYDPDDYLREGIRIARELRKFSTLNKWSALARLTWNEPPLGIGIVIAEVTLIIFRYWYVWSAIVLVWIFSRFL